MEELRYFGEKIIRERFRVAREINTHLDKDYIQEIQAAIDNADLLTEYRSNLIQCIGEAVLQNNTDAVLNNVSQWAKSISEKAISHGVSLDKALKTFSTYRSLIWKLIEEDAEKIKLSPHLLLRMRNLIDTALDFALYSFSVSFAEYHKTTIEIAQRAILNLSVPVVSLSKEIAILPLIGELDTYRAKILMETSLQRCIKLKNSILIIDLSGVPIVDTMVAHQLFQVAHALKLIGVQAIFTGIRPDIAQAVVSLGIDFGSVKVMGNLRQALDSLIGVQKEQRLLD